MGDDRQELRDLAFAIGRTLLICQVLEQTLKDVLTFMRANVDVSDWLDTGTREERLVKVIAKLSKRFQIGQNLFNELNEFRLLRNKFVHDVWGVSEQRLHTKKGREETLLFVEDPNARASALNLLFAPALVQFQGRFVGIPAEITRSMIPPSWRDFLPPEWPGET
jgi:hypothetical protein